MAAWTVSREVRNKVGNFDSDWIFTLRDLDLPPCFAECAVKALNKMVREGELKKFSKGTCALASEAKPSVTSKVVAAKMCFNVFILMYFKVVILSVY